MKFKLTKASDLSVEKSETIEINTLEELLNITDEDIIIYRSTYPDNLPEICIYDDYVE